MTAVAAPIILGLDLKQNIQLVRNNPRKTNFCESRLSSKRRNVSFSVLNKSSGSCLSSSVVKYYFQEAGLKTRKPRNLWKYSNLNIVGKSEKVDNLSITSGSSACQTLTKSGRSWRVQAGRRLGEAIAEEDNNDNGGGEVRGGETPEDMEKFLDSLALEYDSVWDTKPAWCQPWTISLTGAVGIGASWEILHWPILTGFVTLLVAAWWYIFLYLYPKAYSELVEERRQMGQKSTEDI